MNAFAIISLSIALLVDITGAGQLGLSDSIEAASGSQLSEEGPAEQAPDPYGTHGADRDEQIKINEAMAAFTDQGLILPELRIYVHDSDSGCDGHLGIYSNGGDKRRIDICHFDPSVIRHELAHAWEHHHMNDATRSAFMDQAEVVSWSDPETGHHARGIERAAYLIAWGLDSDPIQRHLDTHFAQDLAMFELLVGFASPRISHWDDPRPASQPRPIIHGGTPDLALS